MSEEGTAHEGIVKWYSLAKGFGFLSLDGEERDIFVHHSLVEGDDRLNEGERVRFTMVDGPKGLQATHLIRLDV